MKTARKGNYPLKWITPQVAIGYAPHSDADIDDLKDQGISAVLNLCAECYDLHEIEVAAGLDVHWLPVADEDAPEQGAAQKALSWMDSKVEEGKKVLVHCRFGIGRTGTLIVAWLLKQGCALDDALEMLRHTPAEPKSRDQWEFIDAYSRAIGKPAILKPTDIEKHRSRPGKFFRKHFLMQQWGAD